MAKKKQDELTPEMDEIGAEETFEQLEPIPELIENPEIDFSLATSITLLPEPVPETLPEPSEDKGEPEEPEPDNDAEETKPKPKTKRKTKKAETKKEESAPPDEAEPVTDTVSEPLPEDIEPVLDADDAPLESASKKKTIFDLDLNKLDRNLTPEQIQEWNSIYASYRSKSILKGIAIGVDHNSFEVMDKETGETKIVEIDSLIVIDYRVKILIPESELWVPGDERPPFVLRNMVGCNIEYVILEVDREGECAVASRRAAQLNKRYYFGRNEHKPGERLTCEVVAVGAKQCTVSSNGYDVTFTQRDLSYVAIPDLREKYHPGMELNCVLKEFDKDAGRLAISVKDTLMNPFIGADIRHPIGSRRQGVINGKYRGGLFCNLPDGMVCHCLYSSLHVDSDFQEGDTVILAVKEFNYDNQHMFGKILSKW